MNDDFEGVNDRAVEWYNRRGIVRYAGTAAVILAAEAELSQFMGGK